MKTLKEWRSDRGLTLQGAAALLGVCKNMYRNWEYGKSRMTERVWARFLNLAGAHDVLRPEGKMRNATPTHCAPSIEWVLTERSIPEPNTGCWLWLGTVATRHPYGMVVINKRRQYAHRVSFETFVGPVGNMVVCHRCDNPPCINPDHLFLGTDATNNEDKMRKGRSGKPSRMLVVKGVSRSLAEWSRIAEMTPMTIVARLKLGWTPEDAIFTTPDPRFGPRKGSSGIPRWQKERVYGDI